MIFLDVSPELCDAYINFSLSFSICTMWSLCTYELGTCSDETACANFSCSSRKFKSCFFFYFIESMYD